MNERKIKRKKERDREREKKTNENIEKVLQFITDK